MTDLISWVITLLGTVSGDYGFIYLVTACVLVVIGFTCSLSLFIGIAFAIFRR